MTEYQVGQKIEAFIGAGYQPAIINRVDQEKGYVHVTFGAVALQGLSAWFPFNDVRPDNVISVVFGQEEVQDIFAEAAHAALRWELEDLDGAVF